MPLNNWKRNLAVLWVAQTFTMIAFSFVFPFIPLYVKSLGVENETDAATWAALITVAQAFSMTIMQPIWGGIADRYGRRPMVIRSMAGAVFVVALMGLVNGPMELMGARFLQGLITGTIPASTALVATTTPKEKVGFALGILQMGFFVGNSVGPLIGGVLADAFGYRLPFFAASALMFVGLVIVILFVREDFVKPTVTAPRRNPWSGSREVLMIGLVPVLCSVIFMINFGVVIVSPVLSLFIENLNKGGNAATVAGFVVAAVGAASAASALVLGKVSDRVGHAVVLPICLIGAAITYFPQAYVQEVWQLLALRLFLGIFLGGMMPSANALVIAVVPQEKRGAAFGLTATATSSSNMIGPMVAAGIVAMWDIRAVFLATGVLYAVAYAWVLVGFRRHQIGRFKPKALPVATTVTEAHPHGEPITLHHLDLDDH